MSDTFFSGIRLTNDISPGWRGEKKREYGIIYIVRPPPTPLQPGGVKIEGIFYEQKDNTVS
jgi:hypothetical protein